MSIFPHLHVGLADAVREKEREEFVEHLAKDAHLHVHDIFTAYWTENGIVIEASPALERDVIKERAKHGYTKVSDREPRNTGE